MIAFIVFSAFRQVLIGLQRGRRAGLAARYLDGSAGAVLDELPGIALEIHGRGPLAGRSWSCRTIILPLERYAEAFVLVGCGRGVHLGLRQGGGE